MITPGLENRKRVIASPSNIWMAICVANRYRIPFQIDEIVPEGTVFMLDPSLATEPNWREMFSDPEFMRRRVIDTIDPDREDDDG